MEETVSRMSLFLPFLPRFHQNSLHDVYMQWCWVDISLEKIGAVEAVLYLWSYSILCRYSHYFSTDLDKIPNVGVYTE